MATKLNNLAVKISQLLQEEWKDIVLFDSPSREPFPVTILPERFRQLVEMVSESTQTPIDASGITFLSVLSAAAAKKFVIKPFRCGAQTETTNLYTLVSMRSGERKSAVYNLLTEPLIKYQQDAQTEYRQKHEGVAEELLKPPTYLTDDVTPEKLIGLMKENNEQMAMLSSEGGLFDNFNGRYSNVPSLDIYLKSFTGDYMTVHRVGRPSETLYEPILTIGLFVQPGLLQGLPARLVERGFLGRFLYAAPQPVGIRKVVPAPIDRELLAFYSRKIEILMNHKAESPYYLYLDEAAERAWIAFAEKHEYRLNGSDEFSHHTMRSWAERFPGQMLRVLSLLHIAEHLQTADSLEELPAKISAETLNRLIQHCEYFVNQARFAFGAMKSDARLDDAKYLLSIILSDKEEVIKKQELWKKTKGKFATAYNLDSTLSILADHGYIRMIEAPSPSGLGRKGVVIEKHPNFIASLPLDAGGQFNEVKDTKPKRKCTAKS
ncbi:YfjI family protein [Paenibacillus lactis]|uniref:YfjI family protein n=1 Tax=Paenibacillus TaxID=44249 RepID=UPI0011A4C6FC|nr:YfjI family protein [Paenibacillus sp. IHBB 10380]